MSDDLIRRSDAIKATWQEPTYTDPLNILTEVRDRIEAVPSADIDLSEYSDKLWKNAYERGKADRPQVNAELKADFLKRQYEAVLDENKRLKANTPQWIPCSERLPKENTEVLLSLEWGIDIGEYRNGDWHSEWINHYDDGDVLAWMPLPKPWKGADDGSR